MLGLVLQRRAFWQVVRPRKQLALRRYAELPRRLITTEIGDGDSGHIEAKPNESILFFNNVLPLRLQWLLWLPLQSDRYLEKMSSPKMSGLDPSDILSKALPGDSSVKVTGLTPRWREGSAFVRFIHDGSLNRKDIEKAVKTYLEQYPHRPWWQPFAQIQTRLVLGRPFVEDLLRRPPSLRLKVEFVPTTAGESVDLSQEGRSL
jgi:hypothetical protein